jgi:hypothetical protein
MNNMEQTAQLTQNLSKNNIDLLDKENKINISGEINGKIENNEIRINNKNESNESNEYNNNNLNKKLYEEDLTKNNIEEENNSQLKKSKLPKLNSYHSSENLTNFENKEIDEKKEEMENLKNDIINDGNFSDPEIKTTIPILKEYQIKNESSDEEKEKTEPRIYDINFDIKKVFKMKPIHEEYNEEELKKLSSNHKNIEKNDYELQFYRNSESIRSTYIAKLIYKKVWVPESKTKTHNSLIIFDWDDTLLCTTFLTPKGYFDENIQLNDKDKQKVQKLEISVLNLLEISVSKGDVYIITNAGPGWVEFSAEKFYPNLRQVLKKIKIISARGVYEKEYPNNSRQWKIQTFLNLQKDLNTHLVTNIICCGDSVFEMEAGKILASKFQQAYIKTIKFRESPKPEELNKQLRLVIDQFNGIYSAVKNLTIRVEKKKK